MEELTPKQIVSELDKYIIGQGDAKKKVAIALRNRWRRQQLDDDMREEVFRPFARLDQSRNPATGGVGLGLTIARDIAHGHGGEIGLGTGPLGGLRATLTLPV